MERQKILVTGASGFLGKNVLNYYKKITEEADFEVYGTYKNKPEKDLLYCNLENLNDVNRISRLINPDTIIHCAANPNPKHPNFNNFDDFVKSHINSTINLAECNPNTRFIFISSINIYGDYYPIIIPNTLYGALKDVCENILNTYQRINDIKPCFIRPSAIVGKNTTHGLLNIIKDKLKQNTDFIELFGDKPGTIKPFVHVNDVIKAIDDSISDNSLIKDVFPNDSISVEEVANIIMDKMQIKKNIVWLGDQMLYKGDSKFINVRLANNIYPVYYKTSKEAIIGAI